MFIHPPHSFPASYLGFFIINSPINALQASLGGVSIPGFDNVSVEDLKSLLRDTLWGTGRGLSADSDTRAEILELISQLEARNPTPEPNETSGKEKLSGTWKLIYTSNSELLPLLALSRLPLVEVGDITQRIDADSLQVENKVQITVPFSRTSLGSSAVIEVRSPKLLQVQFQEGQIATPELLDDFELPSSVDVMGQSVDLSPLQSALRPLDEPVRSTIRQIGSLLSGSPDLKIPIRQGRKTSTWLLTTYLDNELRISRGDGGSVFVLERIPDGPPALDYKIENVQEDTSSVQYAPVAVEVEENGRDINGADLLEGEASSGESEDTEPSPEY